MPIKILDTDKEIYRMITVFTQSETYQALLNGDLVGIFGFPNDSQKRMKDILDRIIDSMKIMFYKTTKINPDYTFNGSIQIHILKSDYEDILSLTAATVNTGQDMIPWLSWMINKGNEYIDKEWCDQKGGEFFEWKIVFRKGAGRSGQAIMEKVVKNPGWRLEVPHAGTPDNNWLTRALFANQTAMKSAFITIFEEELNR